MVRNLYLLGDHRVILLQLVRALNDRIVLVDALGELVYLCLLYTSDAADD